MNPSDAGGYTRSSSALRSAKAKEERSEPGVVA